LILIWKSLSRAILGSDVENKRWLGQLNDLLTYFDERQAGTNLSGPLAAHIEDAGRRSDGSGPLLVDFGFKLGLPHLIKSRYGIEFRDIRY
jgi:hypothetical protein